MFERLDQIEARYEELTQALASPDITNDSAKYQKTAKAHSEIAPIVEKYREYKDLTRGIADSKAMLADETDAEMRAYAEEELAKLEARVGGVEEELKVLLLPKDPNDEKNVVLEIRAGTGGDEATLFVAEVFRMYNRYAETQKWKVEVLSTSESGVGGLKEVIALIEGDRVYSRLKYESGVHRVQRVPQPSSRDACTLRPSPSRCCRKPKTWTSRSKPKTCASILSVLRTGRPVGEHDLFGGAHHAHSDEHGRQLPGREIADQEPRKRHARVALPPLRSRDAEAAGRAGQRTQADGRLGRPLARKFAPTTSRKTALTDHRIGFTIHQLEQVMDGKLQPIIDALITHYQAEKMKQETAAWRKA